MANAPNVLQPYWFIVLPLDVPDLTASLLLWGPSGARGGDVYEPSYFRMFQLSPLVVFKRSLQPQVELRGREMADEFFLKMPYFHVTFRDLLHAVNLRYGTDGFTSPLKEGVLRIFSSWKIRWLRSGLNLRTWVPKSSTLPLDHRSRKYLP